jgi:hypothetical protein
MNPALPPALSPGVTGLHTRRCVRHTTREAAARCPACGDFFCRECVVEHDGKLLCSGCLAKQTAARDQRRERLAGMRRGLRAVAGAAALWLVFYGIGALLKKIPPDLHDGTVWKKLSDRSRR